MRYCVKRNVEKNLNIIIGAYADFVVFMKNSINP